MRAKVKGFTILEIIAVILLLLILILVCAPYLQRSFASISQVRCMSNLRNLHVGFESYIQDNGRWPQEVDTGVEYGLGREYSNNQEYEDWWINTMAPYVDPKVWQCPVLKAEHLKDMDNNPVRLDYTPTMFDANPISPHRWPKQPWLIEIANAHGHGPLILMPDGSITDYFQVFNLQQ